MRNANIIAAILRKRANAGGGGGTGDADADAIIAALTTAGATPDETAEYDLVTDLKSDGIWTSIAFLGMPIFGIAAANAINFKSPGSSGTFVGSVTHSAGYVQGASASGYFKLADDATGVLTQGDGSMWFYSESSKTTTNEQDAGWANQHTIFFYSTGSAYFDYPVATRATFSGMTSGDRNGVLIGSRHSGTTYLRRRKSGGVDQTASTTAANSGTVPNSALIVMARNSDVAGSGDVTAERYTEAKYRSWGYGAGLTTAQMDNLSLRIYEYLTAYGLSPV